MELHAHHLLLLLSCILPVCFASTDLGVFSVLDELRRGLDDAGELGWPPNSTDPCGPPPWPHLSCLGPRVAKIHAEDLSMRGKLPPSLNRLSMLSHLGLQGNHLRGRLPSFQGLARLRAAYLEDNMFDEMPDGFFVGLARLQVLSLDRNLLNKSSGGWRLPPELASVSELVFLLLVDVGIVGPVPDFLGRMPRLRILKLSYDNLTGGIPGSFATSSLEILLSNDQDDGLSGPIDVVASMILLTDVWLQGNRFSGRIPAAIGACTALQGLWLHDNQLVGLIPVNLTSLPQLHSLRLDRNQFMGSIPVVSYKFSYSGNMFCVPTPGEPCAPEVAALLDFLDGVGFPQRIANSWVGDNACLNEWLGISCHDEKVSAINLSDFELDGTVSPSLGNLSGLRPINFARNNLRGALPASLTRLKLLKVLDVSDNGLSPPLPMFDHDVLILDNGNPLLHKSSRGYWWVFLVVCGTIAALAVPVLCIWRNKANTPKFSPGGSALEANTAAADLVNRNAGSSILTEVARQYALPLSVLRSATENFSARELGQGGSGKVYLGRLADGTGVAVKRMNQEARQNLEQFKAEVNFLGTVRHRNLVRMVGYCSEDGENLLVYEYMSEGDLRTGLFHQERKELVEQWARRLRIAC